MGVARNFFHPLFLSLIRTGPLAGQDATNINQNEIFFFFYFSEGVNYSWDSRTGSAVER